MMFPAGRFIDVPSRTNVLGGQLISAKLFQNQYFSHCIQSVHYKGTFFTFNDCDSNTSVAHNPTTFTHKKTILQNTCR